MRCQPPQPTLSRRIWLARSMRTLLALAGSIDAFKICICASCGLNFATSEEVKFRVKTNLWCTCSCYILVSRKVFDLFEKRNREGLLKSLQSAGSVYFAAEKNTSDLLTTSGRGEFACLPTWCSDSGKKCFFLNCRQVFENVEEDL